MPSRLAVRGVVSGVALLTLAAVLGWAPLGAALAVAAVAAVALAGEALIAVRTRATEARRPGAPPVREALADTSALIDGRLLDVVATGFLDLDLVVPEFVLRELQHVADASDTMRRARGRRGLDVLAELRGSPKIRLRVIPDDVPDQPEVDLKLVELAVRRSAVLITTDFNLNKVAAIRGVTVLNVNDLAHALRPVLLPGEAMRVALVKEGKEPGQGVAYLEDGTMVVVDHARSYVGQSVEVVVTSAIQTAAGKMFFAKLAEPAEGR
jgi:uncharacterized protein YacL